MRRAASDAYSAIASRYDGLERRKGLLRRGRAQSLAVLKQHMPEDGRLLELGCGTGTEALEVARTRNATIVAFDPSPEMVESARAKAGRGGARVEWRQGSATEALRALGTEGARFDGAWASFSLAYDAPLDVLRDPLARVLRPDAPFVCSLPNPWVLSAPWRIPARILGRARNRVDGSWISMRATSPRAAARAFSPDFSLTWFQGLSVLVPPARWQRLWDRVGPAGRRLEELDERWSSKPFFRALGDHTIFVFRRRRA